MVDRLAIAASTEKEQLSDRPAAKVARPSSPSGLRIAELLEGERISYRIKLCILHLWQEWYPAFRNLGNRYTVNEFEWLHISR